MKYLRNFSLLACLIYSGSTFASFINFDSYSYQDFGGQTVSGSALPNGNELTLAGNLWVYLSDTFTITSDTVLYFTMEGVGLNAETFGIGLDQDARITPQTLFQTGGSDITRANQVGNYTAGDGSVDFIINVGDYFTGTFSQLVFILDNDAMPSGSQVTFSNVEFCDSSLACFSTSSDLDANPVNAPSVAILSLFALFFAVRKRRSA